MRLYSILPTRNCALYRTKFLMRSNSYRLELTFNSEHSGVLQERKSDGPIDFFCFMYFTAPTLDRCAPSTLNAGVELPDIVIVVIGTA